MLQALRDLCPPVRRFVTKYKTALSLFSTANLAFIVWQVLSSAQHESELFPCCCVLCCCAAHTSGEWWPVDIVVAGHTTPPAGLGLTMAQFVDTCILSGCDYADTIKGVAATTAHKLVKQHGSLEAVVASIEDKSRVPEVDWAEERSLFETPEVTDPDTLDR